MFSFIQRKRAAAALAAARAGNAFGGGGMNPGMGGAMMGSRADGVVSPPGKRGRNGQEIGGGGINPDMQGDPSVLQDRLLTGVGNTFGLSGGGGYGGGGYGGLNYNYGLESSCPEGVNQNSALLATAAAIAVGAGVIYRAVTLQQGRRRRRAAEERKEDNFGLMELVMQSISKYREINL